jgi:hypothetical protein
MKAIEKWMAIALRMKMRIASRCGSEWDYSMITLLKGRVCGDFRIVFDFVQIVVAL